MGGWGRWEREREKKKKKKKRDQNMGYKDDKSRAENAVVKDTRSTKSDRVNARRTSPGGGCRWEEEGE